MREPLKVLHVRAAFPSAMQMRRQILAVIAMICCLVEIYFFFLLFSSVQKSRAEKRATSDREPVSSWWRLDRRKNVEPQWNGRDRPLGASFLLVQGSGPDKGPCAAAQTDLLSAVWRNVSDHHGYRSERSPRCGYWDCSVRSHTSSVCRLTPVWIMDVNLGVIGGAGGQGWLSIMFTPL